MKTLLKIFLIFLIPLSVSTQQQSSIGGGYEESKSEKSTDPESRVIDDNYSEIPANDIYGIWDTRNIHAYSFNKSRLKDTLTMVMAYDSCDFVVPHDGHITSPFGNRSGGYHHGTDVKLRTGEKVKSAFEGMVRISQYSSSYGHVVVIRHNNGLETLYAHLSKRKVKPGDHVEAGDLIGLGGNTGRSSGSHLHFECRFKGEPVNPSKIIDWKAGILKTDTVYLTKNNFKTSKNLIKKKVQVKKTTEKSLNAEKKPVENKPVVKKATVINKTPKTKESKKVVQKKTVEKKKVETKKTVEKKAATKVKSVPAANKKYHKIKSGDTIYSLARVNGVTVNQIRKWNNIGSNNLIKVGTKIRVQ